MAKQVLGERAAPGRGIVPDKEDMGISAVAMAMSSPLIQVQGGGGDIFNVAAGEVPLGRRWGVGIDPSSLSALSG